MWNSFHIAIVQNLDEELKVATEAFLESDSCSVDLARREVSNGTRIQIKFNGVSTKSSFSHL